MSQQNEVILRFDGVSFEYGRNKPILDSVDFSVRRGAKIALMGQNGAGKSTIFKLITGEIKPDYGMVAVEKRLTVGTARQVIPREQTNFTVREFFESVFSEKVYNIGPRIDKVLEVVNLIAPHERVLDTFSGGQQARLLLAQALIQDPELLLLDEPTNNLDKSGIAHLTKFLINYKKTAIVISHDSDFLNSFTHGVIYLESFHNKIEQYVGDYLDVVKEINLRREAEERKNVRLEKDIQHRKDQANFFGQKGGHLRDVAKKMREKIEKLEEDVVEVRKEDKTIRNFNIPSQEQAVGKIIELKSVSVVKNHGAVTKKVNIILYKGERLLLTGPNGIGKTTLLEKIANGEMKDEYLTDGVRIGYYRQDFSNLDFDKTVYQTLRETTGVSNEQQLRSQASGFLLDPETLKSKIGSLSEGQKGLVSFAILTLTKPGLLILDEPTNHINFRHIPVIAKALDSYQGAMILVSHVPGFVKQIKVDQTLDLEKL